VVVQGVLEHVVQVPNRVVLVRIATTLALVALAALVASASLLSKEGE